MVHEDDVDEAWKTSHDFLVWSPNGGNLDEVLAEYDYQFIGLCTCAVCKARGAKSEPT